MFFRHFDSLLESCKVGNLELWHVGLNDAPADLFHNATNAYAANLRPVRAHSKKPRAMLTKPGKIAPSGTDTAAGLLFEVVLSGVTGRTGAHVLHHALQNALASTAIALSSRPPPGIDMHAKLEVSVAREFTKYPDGGLTKLFRRYGCA
jgi:hypothetical protein